MGGSVGFRGSRERPPLLVPLVTGPPLDQSLSLILRDNASTLPASGRTLRRSQIRDWLAIAKPEAKYSLFDRDGPFWNSPRIGQVLPVKREYGLIWRKH
jgi:hypothetical protein